MAATYGSVPVLYRVITEYWISKNRKEIQKQQPNQ